MATHELHSSPETCHWGYFDSKLPPQLKIKSGDIATIHCVSGSKEILPEPPMNVLPEHREILAKLTPQQLRVLQMLRQGLLNKQIAYELQVGETTVKAHVSEILRKLNVYSRTQAVIEVSKLDNAELFRDQAGF